MTCPYWSTARYTGGRLSPRLTPNRCSRGRPWNPRADLSAHRRRTGRQRSTCGRSRRPHHLTARRCADHSGSRLHRARHGTALAGADLYQLAAHDATWTPSYEPEGGAALAHDPAGLAAWTHAEHVAGVAGRRPQARIGVDGAGTVTARPAPESRVGHPVVTSGRRVERHRSWNRYRWTVVTLRLAVRATGGSTGRRDDRPVRRL